MDEILTHLGAIFLAICGTIGFSYLLVGFMEWVERRPQRVARLRLKDAAYRTANAVRNDRAAIDEARAANDRLRAISRESR